MVIGDAGPAGRLTGPRQLAGIAATPGYRNGPVMMTALSETGEQLELLCCRGAWCRVVDDEKLPSLRQDHLLVTQFKHAGQWMVEPGQAAGPRPDIAPRNYRG